MFDIHANSFMGMQMTQAWSDLQKWENFFNEHPIKTFIELGTGVGGMSLFLTMQCRQRGIEFHTFDNQQFMDFGKGLPVLLDMQRAFRHVDLFSDSAREQIESLFREREHPIAIFFDNGDKPREWKLFTPYTQPGDYCICHDWNTEIGMKDIMPGVDVEQIHCGVVPFAMELTTWFKRI